MKYVYLPVFDTVVNVVSDTSKKIGGYHSFGKLDLIERNLMIEHNDIIGNVNIICDVDRNYWYYNSLDLVFGISIHMLTTYNYTFEIYNTYEEAAIHGIQ